MVGDCFEKYTLDYQIDEGAFGSVYGATDTLSKRQVAIKILHPHLTSDPVMLARFRHEAQRTAAVHHPGIVEILDFIENDGRFGIVMEFVNGVSLNAYVDEKRNLSLSEKVRIAAAVADALQAAHEAGIVHRDVKPGNILIDKDGRPHLTDFGLAKLLNDTQSSGPVTETGSVLGTPAYMSPEHCAGKPVTPSSDVYALGVVLYELVAGTRPFYADTPQGLLQEHIHTRPRRLRLYRPSAPIKLDMLVRRCLSKNPRRRPPSAKMLAEALRSIDITEETPPDLGGETQTLISPVVSAKRRFKTVAVFVVTVAIFAAVAVVTWLRRAETMATPEGPPVWHMSRVVSFPSERSVGELWISESGRPGEWENLIEAQGDIAVPAGNRLRLNVSEDAFEDLSWLADLDPDALQVLKLIAGGVYDADLEYIVHLRSLLTLNVNGRSITDAGIAYIAQIKQLESLDLSQSGITDDGLALLARMSSLTSLSLDESLNLTDEGLRVLGDGGKLTHLALDYNPQLTDELAPHVAKLTSLEHLFLGKTQLTDNGLARLSGLTNLQRLSLEETKITDKGLTALHGMRSLNTLWLFGTRVTDAGVQELRRNLPQCDIIGWADTESADGQATPESEPADFVPGVSSNHAAEQSSVFQDEKLESLVRETLAKPTGTLTQDDLLYLTRLDAQDRGIQDLSGLQFCSNLEVLNLHSPEHRNNVESLRPISDLGTLRWLNLCGAQTVDDDALRDIVNLTGLFELDISHGPDISDEGVTHIAHLRQLGILRLDESAITNESLAVISQFGHLEILNLAECMGIDDDGMKHVAQLSELRHLNIIGAIGITARGLSQLKGLEKLEEVFLGGYRSPIDSMLETLGDFPSLRTVCIVDANTLSETGLRSLEDSETLRTLTLVGDYSRNIGLPEMDALRAALPKCSIQMRHFPDTRLEESVCSVLDVEVGSLTQNDLLKLTQLDAQTCGIRDLRGLEYCANLESVDLTSVDASPDQRNAPSSLYPIATLPALRRLCLAGVLSVNAADLRLIGSMQQLVELDLSECPSVQDPLLPSLEGLQRLETLNFRGSGVTEEGVARLRKALPNCRITLSD